MSGSLWSLAIPAAVGLGSAYLGSRASQQAANTAAQATDRASDVQLQMFDQNRADLAPYREAGYRALPGLEAGVGDNFQQSPGYQFAVGEGVNAIDRGASARGLLNSGARLRELMRYGTGMANQEYGNWWNRKAALAGIGQTATGQTGMLGANAANNVAQNTMSGGQAQAGATIGGANAALGGINQGVGLWAMMNQPGWGTVKPQPQPRGVE
jgi:hypothetical protein